MSGFHVVIVFNGDDHHHWYASLGDAEVSFLDGSLGDDLSEMMPKVQ